MRPLWAKIGHIAHVTSLGHVIASKRFLYVSALPGRAVAIWHAVTVPLPRLFTPSSLVFTGPGDLPEAPVGVNRNGKGGDL